MDNVPKISSEHFAHIRKTYVSQDDKVIQEFCLRPVFNSSMILFEVLSGIWNKLYFFTPSCDFTTSFQFLHQNNHYAFLFFLGLLVSGFFIH